MTDTPTELATILSTATGQTVTVADLAEPDLVTRLGMDFHDALNIPMEIDEAFNIRLIDADFERVFWPLLGLGYAMSFADLVKVIEAKRGQAAMLKFETGRRDKSA